MSAFKEITKTDEEKVELAKSFSGRAEMLRDMIMCYQPLCCQRIVREHGMAGIIEQIISDVLTVQTDFGGSFPEAIGEIDGPSRPDEEGSAPVDSPAVELGGSEEEGGSTGDEGEEEEASRRGGDPAAEDAD